MLQNNRHFHNLMRNPTKPLRSQHFQLFNISHPWPRPPKDKVNVPRLVQGIKITFLTFEKYQFLTIQIFPKSFFYSSFSSQDRTKPFDLAKLLDPFEQLEREFNWEDVTLKPPSAFCSLVDVREEQERYVTQILE